MKLRELPIHIGLNTTSEHGVKTPFALPEEELAIWGIVSPYNMLRPEAQDRYMDLFTRVFHITREQLISKAINDVKLEVE